jgi:hypothetical protein
VRSIIPRTAENRRAGVFAAIYTVSYLAFGLPAIVSGVLIDVFELAPVVIGLVTVIALLGVAGLAVEITSGPRSRTAVRSTADASSTESR